jgi:large subunit ribosomal protein L10
MAVSRAKKAEALKKLSENFAAAKAVYFATYKGLSVKDFEALRQKVRESNARISVAKKTLIQIAAKENGYEVPKEVMDGPVAAIFAMEDQVSPAKAVDTFLKSFDELSLVGGLLDGKVMDKKEAVQLASLPSREELLAKLLGSMRAPISGFHGVLHGVMRGFVGTLAAYKDQKANS